MLIPPPFVLYSISRLVHKQTNRNIFICGSFDRAQAPCSAYPFIPCIQGFHHAHAAADRVLLGFMSCVLSGQRIPPRLGCIVDVDLPKSHTERS